MDDGRFTRARRADLFRPRHVHDCWLRGRDLTVGLQNFWRDGQRKRNPCLWPDYGVFGKLFPKDNFGPAHRLKRDSDVRVSGGREGSMHSIELTPKWNFVSDRVMGGVSVGALRRENVAGRDAVRLIGQVSLENDGGFVQIAFDLANPAEGVDPGKWTGIELCLFGNGETYDVRLRTTQLTRPWQSFRAKVAARACWTTTRIPFTNFVPHRTDARFEPTALHRIGLLAIGRVFEADLAVSRVGFYRLVDRENRS